MVDLVDYLNNNREKFELICDRVKYDVQNKIEEANLYIALIEKRVKSADRLKDKLTGRDRKYVRPEFEITDICGIRIICFFEEDVNSIVRLIEENFNFHPKFNSEMTLRHNELGYIGTARIITTGYDCDTINCMGSDNEIPCEIQVRTICQHAWASIEHKFNYSNKISPSDEIKRKLFRLQALLEVCDDSFNGIRSEVENQIKSSFESISSGDETEINGKTLMAFANKNDSEYEKVFSELRKRGHSFLKRQLTDYADFDRSAHRLSASGITDFYSLSETLGFMATPQNVERIDTLLERRKSGSQKHTKQTHVLDIVADLYGTVEPNLP